MANFGRTRRFSYTRSPRRPVMRFLGKCILFITVIFLLSLFINTFIFDTFQVETVSMRPGCEPGDRLFTSSLWYGARIPFTEERLPGIFSPRRGDLVVLSPPYKKQPQLVEILLNPLVGFFSLRNKTFSLESRREWENDFVIKRIIALPGDTVRIQGQEAFVKPSGTPDFVSEFSLSLSGYEIIQEELPPDWQKGAPLAEWGEDVVLGAEEYFVLSDARNGSLDSRLWGPVHEEQIVTRVLFRYWPLRRQP